jgi:hypothetical protein
MPLYFFKISLEDALVGIGDGIDLQDDEAAWVEATTACGEMLKDIDGALKKGGEWRMEVQDHARRPLYTLRLVCEFRR